MLMLLQLQVRVNEFLRTYSTEIWLWRFTGSRYTWMCFVIFTCPEEIVVRILLDYIEHMFVFQWPLICFTIILANDTNLCDRVNHTRSHIRDNIWVIFLMCAMVICFVRLSVVISCRFVPVLYYSSNSHFFWTYLKDLFCSGVDNISLLQLQLCSHLDGRYSFMFSGKTEHRR